MKADKLLLPVVVILCLIGQIAPSAASESRLKCQILWQRPAVT
jgi:hypothetical protein